MKTRLFVSMGMALALGLPAASEAAPKGNFWGKLSPKLTGGWARMKVMKKGFCASLVKRAEKKHSAFAPMLREALRALNDSLGKCGGRWPNFRLALCNIAAGAAAGAGKALAGAMKDFTEAMKTGCGLVGKGGMSAVVKALEKAREALQGAKPPFLKSIGTALSWMKKGNLWAGAKKVEAKPAAAPTPAATAPTPAPAAPTPAPAAAPATSPAPAPEKK